MISEFWQERVVKPMLRRYWLTRASFMAMTGRLYYLRDAPDWIVWEFLQLYTALQEGAEHQPIAQRIGNVAHAEARLRSERRLRKMKNHLEAIISKAPPQMQDDLRQAAVLMDQLGDDVNKEIFRIYSGDDKISDKKDSQ